MPPFGMTATACTFRNCSGKRMKGGEESARERLRDAVAVGGEAFRSKMKRVGGGGNRETRGRRELRRRMRLEDVLRAVEQVK